MSGRGRAAPVPSMIDGSLVLPSGKGPKANDFTKPYALAPSYADSFSYKKWDIVEPGLYYQAQRYGQKGLGEFFTHVKPINSMDAEEMLNIKAWGNNAEQIRIIQIGEGLEGWQGGIKGGVGHQIYIPRKMHNDFVKEVGLEPLFVEQLKWITRP